MVIEVKNLTKLYKELTALDSFSMSVKEGEILGLLGPNGSGKTTLIKCILSVLEYESGSVDVFGKPMSASRIDAKANIGLVPQEITVFENLNVRENIDYFCSLYVPESSKRKSLVDEAIAFTKLEKFEKFKPAKLSGGLLRRLNLACGIVHKPKLIILDEPTVAVDAQVRQFILDGLKKLNENGATILYTTHYLEEAEELCDRIIIMDFGKVIAQGTLSELKNSIRETEIVELSLLDVNDSTIADLKKLPNILSVERNENKITLKFSGHNNNLASLIQFMTERSICYTSLNSKEPNLNEVFLSLTGKELRE